MAVKVEDILENVEGIILIVVFLILLGALFTPLINAVNQTQSALAGTGMENVFGIVTTLVAFGAVIYVVRVTLPRR